MKRTCLLMLMTLLVGSCASVRGASEAVIGAIYPTGGSHGTGGIEEWWGVQLAAEYANRTAERPVRLDLEAAETADAVPAAVRRLHDRGVPVMVGSYGSTLSRTAAAIASELGLVYWETGAVGELSMKAAVGERVFRVPAAGGVLGRNAVVFVRDELAPAMGHVGPLRWAVAYVDDVYGRSVGLGAIAEVNDSGHEVAATLPYDPATVDADGIAAQVAESGADVLAVAAYLEDGIQIREAILDRKVPLLANIGTSSSYCMLEFGHRLGDKAVGLFASDKPAGEYVDPARLTPEAAAALRWGRETYRERHGAAMTAPALAGFSGAWALFAKVLSGTGSVDADDVARAAVETKIEVGGLPNGSGLDLAGPGEPEPGSNRAAGSVIWEWVDVEKREIVAPEAFATHPLVVPTA